MSEQNPPPPQSFGSAPAGAQSFGNAPAGDQSFGTAPQGGQTIGAAPEPAAPVKKKSPLVRYGITAALIAAVAAGGWWFSRDSAARAEVGQCLAGTTAQELDADNLKIVDCGAADAGFKVVQRVEGKTSAESDAACTNPEAGFVFWTGKPGQAGTVLCLAQVTG